MRLSYTPDQIEERYQKLPDALKQALFAPDVAEKIFNIGKKHGLTIEKIGLSADEAGAVILGFTKPNNFIGYLAEALEIGTGKAGEIAADINHEILFPLREELKKTHGIDFNADAIHPSFMTPPTKPTAPPTAHITPTSVISQKSLPQAASPAIAPSQTFAQKSSVSKPATPSPLSPSLTRPTPPFPPAKSEIKIPSFPEPATKTIAPLSSKSIEEETPPPPRIISPHSDIKPSISSLFKKSSLIMPQKPSEPEKRPTLPPSTPPPKQEEKSIPPPTINQVQMKDALSSAVIPPALPQNKEEKISVSPLPASLPEKKIPSLPRYMPPMAPKPIDLRNPSVSTPKPASPLMPATPPKTIAIPNKETSAETKKPSISIPADPKESVTAQKEHIPEKHFLDSPEQERSGPTLSPTNFTDDAKRMDRSERNENDPYREPME